MAQNEEELKKLLMKVKEESEKVGLKLNIWNTKIMAYSPITSWQIDEQTMETGTNFIVSLLQWWLLQVFSPDNPVDFSRHPGEGPLPGHCSL